jgi:hypothetical protein
MTESPDQCPKCGSKKVARILYGFPVLSEELERKLDAGKIVLGGCTLFGDDPTWQCVDCEHRWGEEAGVN